MQVDKSGHDEQPAGIDHLDPPQRRRDRRHPPAADPDVGVQYAGAARIDDASAGDDELKRGFGRHR